MKASRLIGLTVIAFAVVLFSLTFTSTSVADESSTVRPYIGYITLKLDEDFVNALVDAGVKLDNVRPGFLNLRRRIAVFPIFGGSIDQDLLTIELFQTGGLVFDPGTGFKTQIINFILSSVSETGPGMPGPVLPGPFLPESLPMTGPPTPPTSDGISGEITALIVFGGNIERRATFFRLTYSEENIKSKYGNALVIDDVDVTVDPFQPENINEAIGRPFLFLGGEPVGKAKIFVRYYVSRRHKFRYR